MVYEFVTYSKYSRRVSRNSTQLWLYSWTPWLVSFASSNQPLFLPWTCLPHNTPSMCGATLRTSDVQLVEIPSIGTNYRWKTNDVFDSMKLEFCNLYDCSQNQSICPLQSHSAQWWWPQLWIGDWEWSGEGEELASAHLFRYHTCTRTQITSFSGNVHVIA